MPSIYPFDCTVYLEDCPPWADCSITLSAFEIEVEVRGPDFGDWCMSVMRYQRPSDRAFVRPASGSEHERIMASAVNTDEAHQQMEAQVRLAIQRTRADAEVWGERFFEAAE